MKRIQRLLEYDIPLLKIPQRISGNCMKVVGK
jgi:hypothetical protein